FVCDFQHVLAEIESGNISVFIFFGKLDCPVSCAAAQVEHLMARFHKDFLVRPVAPYRMLIKAYDIVHVIVIIRNGIEDCLNSSFCLHSLSPFVFIMSASSERFMFLIKQPSTPPRLHCTYPLSLKYNNGANRTNLNSHTESSSPCSYCLDFLEARFFEISTIS